MLPITLKLILIHTTPISQTESTLLRYDVWKMC